MHFIKAVFRRQHKGFGQIITGDHSAFFFRVIQKFHSFFGIGCVVQIKDSDDGCISDRHIIADG